MFSQFKLPVFKFYDIIFCREYIWHDRQRYGRFYNIWQYICIISAGFPLPGGIFLKLGRFIVGYLIKSAGLAPMRSKKNSPDT